MPFDPELFYELNVKRFELEKTGKINFNYPEGTHDDRFWALVYAAEQKKTPFEANRKNDIIYVGINRF